MTFSSNVQGLVLLAFLMCIPHSLGEPWPKSQFGQSGDSDVHIQKSGVVRHTAGEGLSVTDTGIYRLRSRESKYHENYKVSQDPDERPVVRESLPGSPWQQEVVEEEEVEEVDLRDASQEELLAYMEQRNKVLERALGEALNQRSPDYVAGTRVVPSHYGAEGPPHTRRRRPLILPVKVLVNTPEGGQGGYSHSGGPGLANGTNSPLDSRGGRNPADPFDRNNETPEWIRRLQGTDSLPVAPETNINPLQSPRSSTDPYSQQRGEGNSLSTPDPWIKQNPFPRGGQDPRTNQGRSQDNNSSPQGINRLTTQDPWININKNQGTGNQGRNAFLNTNQNQGTNQDPWKNTQGPQGTSSYPFSNQGRNQGTNQFTDQRGNQGTTNAYSFNNQNRNQAPRTGPWVNVGKNQGTSIFPQANQGRIQGINRYPQRTNTSPFTNQGKNPRGSPFPSRNQGNNPYPSPNQGLNQPIDSLPLPSQLPNFFPPITQGHNQGTNFLPLPTQGQRQQLGPIPLANQNRFQTTTTYPSANQGRNQGSYVTTNQRRNQGRNAFTSTNQRNQNTNSGRWSNRGRNQATGTNAWKNEAKNQGNTQSNTGPSNNKNTNQGTARSNSYSRSNQRNTRGRNSQSIYPESTSYQNTRGTNSPYPRSPFRKQNDFSNAWPTKNPDTNLEGSDKETSNGDDNDSADESPTSRSEGQSIFSHIHDKTDSLNLNSQRRSLNQYTKEPAKDQQSTNSPTQTPHTQPPSQRIIYTSPKRNFPSPSQSTEPQQPKSHPPLSTKLQKDKSPVGSVPKKQNKEQSRSPYSPPPEHNKPTPISPTFETIPSRKRRNVQQPKRQPLPSTTQPQGDKSSVNSDPKKQTKEQRKSPYSPPPEHTKPTPNALTSETIPSRKRRNVQQPKSQPLQSTTKSKGDKSPDSSDPKKQNNEQRKSPYSPPPEHNQPIPDSPTSETIPNRKRRNVQQSESQPMPSTTEPKGDKSSMSSVPKKQNKEQSRSPYSPPPEHNEPTPNAPTSETNPSRKRRDMQQPESQLLPSTTQPQGEKSSVNSDPKKQTKEHRKSPYSPPPEHNESTPNAPTSETIPSRKRRDMQQPESQPLPSTTQPQGEKSLVNSDPKNQTKEQRKSPYSPPPEHNKPTPDAPTSETTPSRKRRNVQQPKSQSLPSSTKPEEDNSPESSDPKKQINEQRKSPYSPPPEHNKPTPIAPTSETIPARQRRNVQQPKSQSLPSSTKPEEDNSPESSDAKKQNKEQRKSPYSPPPEHNQLTPTAPISETIPSRKRRNVQQPKSQPLPSTKSKGDMSPESSDPQKQNKEHRKSPYSPPPEHNQPTPNTPTSETMPSRKRRNVQPFENDYNQGPPPPPARNGYAGHSPSDYNHDDPFMTSEDDNSQDYDYPTGPHDTDGNQQRNTDLPGREVHGQNPNFQPRPGLKYYNYQPTTQPQRKRPPPPTRTYPSLESNPPRKNKHRTFDDREQKNPPRENKPRQNDDHKEKIGDEGRHVHGVNPNFKPARKQKLLPKQYYRHKHRPIVPYTDSSVQMHPSLRRKRDVRNDDNEHINIHLSPRSFETRVIISSPLEVERFKNKRLNAEEDFPSGNFPNVPSITAYRGSYASSGRERNVRSSALRKETKDSRGFVGHRAQGEGNSGEPVSRATSRARFSKSRYAPAGSTYYKAGASSRDSRRISSRQRSQKPRYNDGYGYSNRYNPRYAHVLGGGGGRGRGGGGVYIYSPAQNSGYGSRRRRGGGAGYHRNQRGGGGGGRYNVPVIENGITALVQIFNNSEDKGAASGTKGGSSQQTGSHFLYNPSTEDLQLVSDSATNGVNTQDDLEGAYFQYNPNTEELKLVTSDDQFVSDVDKASNDSRGRTNQIKSNSVPQGSYIQYNTDTHELKLKPGSDSSRSSSSSTKNNNQGSQGAFFTYDPATQKLKLSKDTGTSATNSNSPYQAKVPSSPFSGSKGSQLVGLIQLENNKAKEGGTSGNNGGYLQFDPSNSGTTTTSNQQNPQGVQGGIEEIKIFVQDDAGGGTAKQNPQQKVVGYVVVDGGSATFLAPNPGASGGYIQFSPVGAGAGTVLQGGGGTDQYLTHKDFANRPLVKPGPDLFLRMFTEGEVFLESDAIVQNFYTNGDVRRMVSHFRALPLEQSRMGSGFMTGRLKGYHVTACRQCGPSNRPMIEFVTLHDTSPKVVRRFHYRMRRYGGNVGWSSSTHPYADGKRQPSLYFGTYPYKNQPQFGVPRFRNQLFDDLSAKKQNKNKNSGRQRRE